MSEFQNALIVALVVLAVVFWAYGAVSGVSAAFASRRYLKSRGEWRWPRNGLWATTREFREGFAIYRRLLRREADPDATVEESRFVARRKLLRAGACAVGFVASLLLASLVSLF